MSVLRGYGTRRLREYNDCNLPPGENGGQFGANDDPRCAGGKYAERTKNKGRKDDGEGNHADFDWGVAMRQRSIHGAELGPEAQLGDPSTNLADTTGMQQLYDLMEGQTSGKAKRNVANEVGDRWKDRLSEDETLAADAFDKWYAEHAAEIRQHAASVGMDALGKGDDGEYSSAQDVPGYGAPDPDDAQSEYEEYYDELRQEAESQAYDYAREEFGKHFDDAQEVAREAITRGLLLHAEHAAGVFNPRVNPTLPLAPGEEFDLVGGELTPEILAGILTKHKLFTKDDFDDPLESDSDPSRNIDVEATITAIFDPNEDDEDYVNAREELMRYAPSSDFREMASRKASYTELADSNSPWAEDIDAAQQEFWRGVGSRYLRAEDSVVDSADAWDRWWDKNSDSVYENVTVDNADSFDFWYQNKYDIAPSEWQDAQDKIAELESKQYGGEEDDDFVADDGEQRESSKYQRWAASWLLSQWASTSGDGSPVPLSLQAAAEQEFGLGKTFTGQFTYRSGSTYEVKQMIEKHGPVLRHFLRAMYDNTQEMLSEIPGDYITLYRGFTANRGTRQEPGLSSVDLKNGSIVGIRMQPMSSFAVRFNTSYDSFGDDFMVARVPKSQIIGSAISGYGCLNEFEVVVLGGTDSSTVKAFFVNKSAWAQGAQAGLRSYSDSGNDMFLRTGPSADKREGYLLKQAQKRMDEFLRQQGRQQPALPISGERV